VIYGKLVVHLRQTDRQTDEVHVEISRKRLAHSRLNKPLTLILVVRVRPAASFVLLVVQPGDQLLLAHNLEV